MLGRALELPAAEREAYLSEACGDDQALRREVERLLRIDTSVADAYDRPLFDFRAVPVAQDPDHIAGFEITAKIGEGGMSTVFRGAAIGTEDPRPVAIKVLRQGMATDDLVQRFRREGAILAALRHPHIVALRGGGMLEDGRPYLVMPFIEGQPVDVACRSLDLDQRLRLFVRICDAVQYAHRNLVVHRDLKPSNILVTANGEPQLLDFGISKLLDPTTDRAVTRTRADLRMLTPAYAAPEQIAGGPLSTACDVYALGTLLYELITDRRPFADESLEEPSEGALLMAKCERDPVRPSDRVPAARRAERRRLRGDLDAIVLQAMERDPEDRYPSVQQLADDLRRSLDHRPVRARPARWTYRAGKFLTRHRLAIALAALVCVVLGAVALERERQRSRAEQAVQRSERVKGFLITLLEEAEPHQGSGLDVPLRQVLAGSSRRLTDLADEPAVQTELMQLLGSIYLGLNEPELASPLLEEGWATRRAAFGANHPSTAESHCALGRRDLLTGELDHAEQRLRQAIAGLRQSSPKHRTELAYCLNELANVHERRSDLEAANEAYREAFDLASRELGPDDKQTLTYGINRAHLLTQRDRHDSAESLLLEMIDQLEGASIGTVMHGLALSNLAVLRFENGRREGAEKSFREALEIYRRVLGPSHPKTLVALANLSTVLRDAGDFEEARGLLEERLELAGAGAGEASPAVADALEDLGAFEQRRGRLEAAREHLTRSLELYRQHHGDDHLSVARTANSLGSVLLTSNLPAEALLLFEQAAKVRSEILGESHPRSAISLGNRGRARLSVGRSQAAVADLEKALATLDSGLGEEHWLTAVVTSWRARSLRLTGDLDRARDSLAPAIRRLEASPSWSPVAEQIRIEWATQQLEMGDLAAAGKALEKALERLATTYGESHPWPTQVGLLLAETKATAAPEETRLLLAQIRRHWPPLWHSTHWRHSQRDAIESLTTKPGAAAPKGLIPKLEALTSNSDPSVAATGRRLLSRVSARYDSPRSSATRQIAR